MTGADGAFAPERRLLTIGLIGLVTAVAFEGMAVPTILPALVADLGGLDLYGWAFGLGRPLPSVRPLEHP